MAEERTRELARRLAVLHRAGDAAFGPIGAGELVVSLVLLVLVPLVVAWIAR